MNTHPSSRTSRHPSDTSSLFQLSPDSANNMSPITPFSEEGPLRPHSASSYQTQELNTSSSASPASLHFKNARLAFLPSSSNTSSSASLDSVNEVSASLPSSPRPPKPGRPRSYSI